MVRTNPIFTGQSSGVTEERNFASLRRTVAELERRVQKAERSRASVLSTPSGAGELGWVKVADPTIHSGSAVQRLNIIGDFDADVHQEYWGRFRLELATGSTHFLRLLLRGVASDANYDTAFAFNWAIGAPTPNELQITPGFSASNTVGFDMWLSKRPGKKTAGHGTGSLSSATATSSVNYTILDDATSNWSEIAIESSVATRILTGSEATFFRRVD